jgi:hypothetical protein
MKNLYSLLFIPFLFFISTNVNAQFYLEFSGGYNFGVNGEGMVTSSADYDIIYNGRYSYGGGANIQISTGYKVLTNLEVGVSFDYLDGKLGGDYSHERNDYWGNYSEYETFARVGQVSPFIAFNYPLSKFEPFLKVGITGVSGVIYHQLEGDYTPYDYEYYGGVSIGYFASIGSLYSLSDKISVFTSLKLISLSYSPTKRYDYEEKEVTNLEKNQSKKYYYPLSSVGFQLGLRYTFLK